MWTPATIHSFSSIQRLQWIILHIVMIVLSCCIACARHFIEQANTITAILQLENRSEETQSALPTSMSPIAAMGLGGGSHCPAQGPDRCCLPWDRAVRSPVTAGCLQGHVMLLQPQVHTMGSTLSPNPVAWPRATEQCAQKGSSYAIPPLAAFHFGKSHHRDLPGASQVSCLHKPVYV